MKKQIKVLSFALAIAVIITAIATLAIHKSNITPSEEGFGGDFTLPMRVETMSSFFETNPIEQDKDEWEYINPYYEAYPRTDNTSNLHSHATAVYENINGQTVMVDTLYRNYKEALNDPNYSCGMLLYQCIKYKIAHPDEEVEISFSSFRISPTIAVCLNPSSPYFGYVRSLYTGDYDGNGFVRIVYLLLEAARMGIDVTIVGQLNSYSVKQYNNTTGKVASKGEPSYIKYFNAGMDYACYEKYAPGETVEDHLTFRPVEWDYDDKAGIEVMHVKTCAVSAYQDKDGFDHNYGVWFSSTNLDAADYKGYNGNGCSQSGVIITNHKDIYIATRNFVSLMAEHYEQESIFEFRKIVNDRTREQVDVALAGQYESVPEDERIVYVGSEADDVFELYFAPLSGDVDIWDTKLNPYCKYIQEFYDSDDSEDVVFSFNNPNFQEDFMIAKLLVEALRDKFITNKRIGNRLGLRCQNGLFDGFDELEKGKDLEFINVKLTKDYVHEKDLLMSYVKDGKRKYITFFSSCNFNSGALYYQTNQILIVKETEETDNIVYTSIGSKSSKGAIVDEGEGVDFSSDERYVMSQRLDSLPLTFKVEFQIAPKLDSEEGYGILFSNNDFWNYSISYQINKDGNPQIAISSRYEANGLEHFKSTPHTFDQVNVATGEKTQLTFIIDTEDKSSQCYVNGILEQSIELTVLPSDDYVATNSFVIGGDYLGSNYDHFEGVIYELSAWADIRTSEEILQDVINVEALEDDALMAHYEFFGRTPNTFCGDLSSYHNDVEKVLLWLEEGMVTSVPEDYRCIAVVGDTQALSYYHPDSICHIYDWTLTNRDERRIDYVVGLGDITELSKASEYEFAKEQIYRLDGKIPFSLIMGNHDKYDFRNQAYMPEKMSDFLFNKTFYNQIYLNQLDGWFGEGDVSCSYNAYTMGETKWLLLNLDYGPTDEMLAWAEGIIETYADHQVIIVTHAYLYRDGSTLDSSECYPASGHNELFNDGDEIYEKLIKKHANIRLVLCGHDPWDHIVCSQTKGDNGNTITQLLINPQYMDKYYGATEMLALLYFSPDGQSLTVRYYSAAKEMYGSIFSQFTISLK